MQQIKTLNILCRNEGNRAWDLAIERFVSQRKKAVQKSSVGDTVMLRLQLQEMVINFNYY